MSWLRRLLGGPSARDARSQRVDYLGEGLTLEKQGDYDAALTSYKLALRDQPQNERVLQNMAIAYSKTGRQEEAIRCYRRALDLQPKLSGAHYGLAFLLLKRGDTQGAETHLERFLSVAPAGEETERWIGHAKQTLAQLRGEVTSETPLAADPPAEVPSALPQTE